MRWWATGLGGTFFFVIRPSLSSAVKPLGGVLFTGLLLLAGCSQSPRNTTAAPAAPTPLQAPAKAGTTLFENVRVFDGRSAQLSPPSNVLVVGHTIRTISASPITRPAGDPLTRIAGGGRVLMPGLIDNHVHVLMSASSQADLLDPKVTPKLLQERATAEAGRMLLRGFTSVRDLGGPMLVDRPAMDRGSLPGPRIYPSGAMISQTSGHGDSRLPHERSRRFFGEVSRGEQLGANFIADGRDEVLTATRENLRAGASQIKVMAGGGAASAYDPLDVTQYTLDEMKAAVEAASDWGTYVTVHAYTPKAVRRAVEAGVKCVEHGQLLDQQTMQLLGQKGIWLSLQALDEAPPTAPENVRRKKHTVVQGTDNAFRWAKQYGVKLAWGTDFLFMPSQNVKQNTDILKLKQWMTPAEVLKLVTHDNAQLLALSGPRNPYPGQLGMVQPGALADLILVDGNPLETLELIGDPQKRFLVIMKDGRIYKNSLAPAAAT
jgi:imidazolonepropionase-like amidohydrolase